jgi:hypothetical protein
MLKLNTAKLTIIATIVVVSIVGTLMSIDGITAKPHTVETVHYRTDLPDLFFTVSPGETIVIPATVVSDSPVPLHLQMAVTKQGDEISHMLGGPVSEDGPVTASIPRDFINLKKVEQPNAMNKDNVDITISASDDAEPGEYPFAFTLHHKRDGPDVNSVTYFYVIVE